MHFQSAVQTFAVERGRMMTFNVPVSRPVHLGKENQGQSASLKQEPCAIGSVRTLNDLYGSRYADV